jgi:tetratricopeptide (TPR) repeat protein
LSKSVTSSLPAAILLLLWWKRGKIRLCDVWPLLPFFAAGLAMGTLTGWMEKTNVGAVGPEFDWLTPLDRLCIAGRAVWFYLYKLIVPLKLTFIYPQWTINPHQRPWLLLYGAAAASALAALWLLRGRLGRGALTAMLFFVGTLVPALGFVNVFPMRYTFVADHFQYLAMIGPVTLAVGAIATKMKRGPAAALAAVVIPALCLASYLQSLVYKDRVTLWRDTVAKNYYSPMAHNNLATALRDQGHIDEAERELWITLDIRKDYMDWIGIGQCYTARGDLTKALYYYRLSAQMWIDSPIPILHVLSVKPHLNIAMTCLRLAERAGSKEEAGRYHAEAMKEYHTALAIDAKCVPALTDYAAALLGEGRAEEAIEQCRRALAVNEFSLSARIDMGQAYQALGKGDEAIKEFQEVLGFSPHDPGALVGMSSAMGARNNIPEARKWALVALQVDPDNTAALYNLGKCDCQERRFDEAIGCFQRIVKLEPYNTGAVKNLQTALAMRADSRR